MLNSVARVQMRNQELWHNLIWFLFSIYAYNVGRAYEYISEIRKPSSRGAARVVINFTDKPCGKRRTIPKNISSLKPVIIDKAFWTGPLGHVWEHRKRSTGIPYLVRYEIYLPALLPLRVCKRVAYGRILEICGTYRTLCHRITIYTEGVLFVPCQYTEKSSMGMTNLYWQRTVSLKLLQSIILSNMENLDSGSASYDSLMRYNERRAIIN